MSESLTDLLATDAELDLIARREPDGSRDLVLAELALLGEAVDTAPLPPVVMPGVRPPAMTNARKGGWALSVTVALMVTSSGVAAAVSEDPLAPLHYMTNQMWQVGQHDGGKIPGWDLNGAMPISTVPGVRSPGAPTASFGGGSGQAVFGQVGTGTGTAGRATQGLSSGAAAGDPRIATGYGSHSPSSGFGSGSGPGSGSGSKPGQGGNSGPGSPGGGTGQDPGNSGGSPGSGTSNPRDPSSPSGPHLPVNPGHANDHAGRPNHPGYEQVPGSGTSAGAHHCRIAHPPIPGASWGGAPTLPTCHSGATVPRQPVVIQRTPKLTPAPPSTSGTEPTPAGPAASLSTEQSGATTGQVSAGTP